MLREIKNSFDGDRQTERTPPLKDRLNQTREVLLNFLRGGEEEGFSVRRKTKTEIDGERFDLEVLGRVPMPEDQTITLRFTSRRDRRSREVTIPTYDSAIFKLDGVEIETLKHNLESMSKDVVPLLKRISM